MTTALKMPRRHMTVAEFPEWNPGDGVGERWQLRDGEPEMMAPASDRHGTILAQLAYLLTAHFLATGGRCRAVIAPGVIPRLRAAENCLVPDIGITCTPSTGAHMLPDPVALIEILSPGSESETRTNLWAYATIPTIAEIVILRSTSIAAEVLRRAADGSWPEQPEMIGADGELRIDSIGFAEPLRSAYRGAGLD